MVASRSRPRVRRRNPARTKPLVLWHATDKAFDRFDPDRSGLGTHFGTYAAAKGRATMTAHIRRGQSRPTGEWRVTKYIVHARNPLRVHDFGTWDEPADVEHHFIRLGLMDRSELPTTRQLNGAAFWSWARRRIEDGGYDSIVYQNKVEDRGKDSYVIWRDDQIAYGPTPNPARSSRHRTHRKTYS